MKKARNIDTHIYSESNNREKGGKGGIDQSQIPPEVSPEKALNLPVPSVVQAAVNQVEKPAHREAGDDIEELVAEETYKLFGPLSYFDWFNMLCAFWSFSEDYNTAWAGSFHDRIKAVDIDWLRRAMAHTWAVLSEEHKNQLREEYRTWRKHDKIFDWKSMARGHEYIAICCTIKFPELRLKRSVYAWTFAEAEQKFKASEGEILLGG